MELPRVLGASDAAWLVAGNMIGAGIFYTPGLVGADVPGGAASLAAWSLGGLLALAGAAVYAELGARVPRAGGDYQYLARAFGPLWGFLSGWAAFLLTFTAATAVMAVVALQHLGQALPPLEPVVRKLGFVLAPTLVLLLTWANARGARSAGRTTVALTALPVIGLLVLFGAGLLVGHASLAWPATARPARPWPVAFGAAMVPVFFAYSGWNVAAYVAGEIRDPGRNLARGLLAGTGLVTLLYLALVLVMLVSVPHATFVGSTTVGAEAAERLLGTTAARVLALCIAVAVIGTANVTLMAGSRIYYAMARDGLAPPALGRLNRAGVPGVALWVGGVWTALLSAIGRVDTLVNWATLAILLLSTLAALALFVLRRRDGVAPFRCPGYPWVPLAYVVLCLGVALASAVAHPAQSAAGSALVLCGVPAYFLLRRPAPGGAP